MIEIAQIDTEKRSVALAGNAGHGKTFLMEFICVEWGYGRLWLNFSLVFMLRCRHLNETLKEKQSLYEILFSFYPSAMEKIE